MTRKYLVSSLLTMILLGGCQTVRYVRVDCPIPEPLPAKLQPSQDYPKAKQQLSNDLGESEPISNSSSTPATPTK